MLTSPSRLNSLFVILAVCVIVVGIAAAQPAHKEEKKFRLGKDSKVTPNLADKVASAKEGDEIPIIIFFKKKEKTKAAKSKAQSAVVSSVESKGGKTKHKYDLIDAISAKMPAGKVAELAGDLEVEKIYYDEILSLPPEPAGESRIAMDVSASAVGADYVWNVLGYTGTGIKVAVVDTGINYSHADLGGGFGAGFRVIGGYDFYNGDSDPMDDNGHGTHVAGTIGANGSIKGVAPNVSLFALKVCNAAGTSCPTSDQIAAIDWSVANGADVISMSIGGVSQPNDEFASASAIIADAAVDKGVVVVIAAGNNGPGTNTIARPGSAGKVITVGASDDHGTISISDDTIAYFSNRGPSAFGRFDPDVVAPGENINSTWYDGGYKEIDGTSMATPHVSGAAALLLQKNSSLTPSQVRAILMHTASNLTFSSIHVFEKGAGIINVTKALTYNISASINGDDRWEESVLPGFSAIAKLNLTNDNDYPVNFTFELEGITDLEGDNSLSASTFSLPSSALVSPLSTTSVDINFTAPSNANPAIYGSTLVVSNDTVGTLRIPIVITVPLVGSGLIQGTVDNYYLEFPLSEGDWIYYKLKSHNGTYLNASLTWTDGSDNLDLYLYAPNGESVDSSTAGSGTYEQVSLSNMVYDEYWAVVQAYTLSGTGSYNLTVTYPAGAQGNLDVTPSSWQGSVERTEVKTITFTIANDASAKSNLNLSVMRQMEGDNDFSTGTAQPNGWVVWEVSTSGIDANNTRYMNVTLDWNDTSKNLDLVLYYYDGTWLQTRFDSRHNNTWLGEAQEKIENADIQHYLKTYSDFGVAIFNYASTESYNLTISLTDIAPWSAASVNETTLSLSASEAKQVKASINGSGLTVGETYDAVLIIQNATEDFASVPIRISVNDESPPIISVAYVSPIEKDSSANITVTISESLQDTFNVYKNGSSVANGSYSNGVPFNVSIDTSQLTLWNYTIWANDTLGNSNSTSIFITIQDATPPSITIHSPANATTGDNTPLLNASFGEIVNYTWYNVDGNATNSTPFPETQNLTLNLSALADGLHNVSVYANDSLGNTNFSIRYFTVDTTPPIITVITPVENQTVLSSSLSFKFFSLDDLASTLNYNLTIDGAVNKSGTATIGANTTVEVSGLTDGDHNAGVMVWDDVININTSETRNFTILTQVAVESVIVPPIDNTTSGSGIIEFAARGVPEQVIEETGITGFEYIVTSNGTTPVVNLSPQILIEPPVGVSDIASEAGAVPGFYQRFSINDSSWFDNVTMIQLRMYYNISNINLPLGVPENTLRPLRHTNGSWVKLDSATTLADGTEVYAAGIINSSQNATHPYVWANLSNFSLYGVGGKYKADLTLNSSDISFSSSSPTEGDSVTISATIHNTNDTNADNFTVELLVDGVFQANNTLTVGNNSQDTTQFSWTSVQGTHTVKIVADTDDVIDELNETNNNASKQITVNQRSNGNGGGGGGGGSAKPTIFIVANDVDWGLAEPYLHLLDAKRIRFTAENYSLLNESISSATTVVFLGGPEALDGVGDIVKVFNPVIGIRNEAREAWYYNNFPYKKDVLIFAGLNREETNALFVEWLNK